MSNTANPNAFTAQTLLGHLHEDKKSKQLNAHRVHPEAGRDKSQGGCPFMSSLQGARVGNDDSQLKAGNRGPVLLEDFWYREKMNHFDHERIPERIVHAHGTAAHGFFQLYDDFLKPYTTAAVLTDTSLKTPVFTRFSTVLGSKGSADTVRDVRGFAVKFYTEQGNWDLVGNNIPVFFVQDALKFVDIIHAGKPEPHNNIPQAQSAHDNFWDFISLTPESTHMVMWTMSDRTIPRSFRTMQGFGVHTFVLVNEQRKRTFVKFHWRPVAGVHSLVWDECLKINGADPDFHRRDLYDSIAAGTYPEWEFGVQLIPEEDEHKFDFDLLDCTKLVPEELVPVRYIGKMVLNRAPDDFFAESEQVAYGTQNIVPGIDFSDDPMLHGRNFSYQDTQLSRLGSVNWAQIPINRPIVPVVNNHREGHMQQNIHVGRVNYSPNRFEMPRAANHVDNSENSPNGAMPEDNPRSYEEKEADAIKAGGFISYPERVAGMKTRARGEKFQEHFKQAQLFFNSMSAVEKLHMTKALSFELSHVDDLGIRQRMVTRLNNVDHTLASNVAAAIGVPEPKGNGLPNHGKTSPALSQLNTAFDSIAGRKVAILAADGYDQAQMAALTLALKAQSAVAQVVSTRKGTIYSSSHKGAKGVPAESKEETLDSSAIDAPWTLFSSKSVLFDATIIVDGQQSVDTLAEYGEAGAWVAETFKHHKAILAFGAGITLLQAANLDRLANLKLAGASDSDAPVLSQGVVTQVGWSATEAPAELEEQKSSVGAVVGAIKQVAGAVKEMATGAAQGKGAEYMPNNATAMFIQAMKRHREWDRNIQKVMA